MNQEELSSLSSDSYYQVWPKQTAGKIRVIEEPRQPLTEIHKQLQRLLSRIEHPEWVYSGIRGRSYVDNAKHHIGKKCVCSLDIESFYQSSRKEFVFRFFRFVMLQPEDVAWILADIATYQDHLPTGSASSQILAFWAYRPMFEELRNIALSEEGSLTVYVDDITISSAQPLSDQVVNKLNSTIQGAGLRLNAGKTKRRGSEEWKVVTGGAISPEGMLTVPNRLRKKIHNSVLALKRGSLDEAGLISLRGLLAAAWQLDPSFHSSLNDYVKYLSQSIK